jgi:N-formylglutamate deformylase
MQDQPPPPFTITGSPGAGPLVLASPHSGRHYPSAFLAQSRLSLTQLRRAEDAWVDDLLRHAVRHGPLLAARYGRAYLDLNRAADELDPAMIADPLPPRSSRSERVEAGLGVLPRIAGHGLDIYGFRLRLAEAEARVEAVHRPYHDALGDLLAAARDRFGHAVLLDCHSMPTPPGAPGHVPQFVLGDLGGRAADAGLVEAVEAGLRADGWRVARNIPYAGGYTTARHGRPADGVHALQIEIDRAAYMDPARLQPHGGEARVAASLERVAAVAAGWRPARWAEAAE